MACHKLRDEQWDRLKDSMPGRTKGRRGPRPDIRLFIDALLFMARSEARTKPNPAAWLRDLIARRLEQALGRPVEVLASLELNSLGALHVHGIIAGLSVGEEAAVKSALTLAGGDSYRVLSAATNTL